MRRAAKVCEERTSGHPEIWKAGAGVASPEDLWIVEWPLSLDSSREKIAAARSAEKLLEGLIDVAQGGRSDALFVVLMDAKVRCKKYIQTIEAGDKQARIETLRAELRELEAAAD